MEMPTHAAGAPNSPTPQPTGAPAPTALPIQYIPQREGIRGAVRFIVAKPAPNQIITPPPCNQVWLQSYWGAKPVGVYMYFK